MIEQLLIAFLTIAGCAPENREYLVWGSSGSSVVESVAVPPDRVWLVRAAGAATTQGTQTRYALELIRPVLSQGGACCWRIPIEGMSENNSTPPKALSRPIVLLPGEKLAVRVNAIVSPNKAAILFVYYDVPKSCIGL